MPEGHPCNGRRTRAEPVVCVPLAAFSDRVSARRDRPEPRRAVRPRQQEHGADPRDPEV